MLKPGTAITAESVGLLEKGDLLLLDGKPARFRNLFMGGIRADDGSGKRISALAPFRFTFIGRPDADGWIAWEGGENPVPGQVFEVRFADAAYTPPCLSDVSAWKHYGDAADIIAFRLSPSSVKAEGQSGEGEDVEDEPWPESPLAKALFDYVQSQFCLDREETSEEAGAILQILADHGVDPTKLPSALRPSNQPVDWSVVGPELVAALKYADGELIECAEYFDQRADADGDSEGFHPNKEMQMRQSVSEALARIDAALARTGAGK